MDVRTALLLLGNLQLWNLPVCREMTLGCFIYLIALLIAYYYSVRNFESQNKDGLMLCSYPKIYILFFIVPFDKFFEYHAGNVIV